MNDSSDRLLPVPVFDAASRQQLPSTVAVSISAHCFNPHFSFSFPGEGVFPGRESQGTSDFIQANIKTPSSGATALFVDMNNHGVVDFVLPPKTRAIRGEAYIDRVNIYTRHEDDSNNSPVSPDEIAKHVDIVCDPVANSIRFLIRAKKSTYKGTINVRLTVVYQTAA